MSLEPVPRKRASNYSRSKGNRAEIEYIDKFKELGFSMCKSSRSASRLLDACGIDLWGVPFNIQVKAGYRKNFTRPDRIFKKMKEDLVKTFPKGEPVHAYPKILIQKLDGYYDENQLVTMMWCDFVKLAEAYVKLKNLPDVQQDSTPGQAGCLPPDQELGKEQAYER
jgi:hypothetical protein